MPVGVQWCSRVGAEVWSASLQSAVHKIDDEPQMRQFVARTDTLLALNLIRAGTTTSSRASRHQTRGARDVADHVVTTDNYVVPYTAIWFVAVFAFKMGVTSGLTTNQDVRPYLVRPAPPYASQASSVGLTVDPSPVPIGRTAARKRWLRVACSSADVGSAALALLPRDRLNSHIRRGAHDNRAERRTHRLADSAEWPVRCSYLRRIVDAGGL